MLASNDTRGKAWDILIGWAVAYAIFSACGLNYPMLLALLVGFSVIVPYIFALVVSISVALTASCCSCLQPGHL